VEDGLQELRSQLNVIERKLFTSAVKNADSADIQRQPTKVSLGDGAENAKETFSRQNFSALLDLQRMIWRDFELLKNESETKTGLRNRIEDLESAVVAVKNLLPQDIRGRNQCYKTRGSLNKIN
jgi:hypothetical protein